MPEHKTIAQRLKTLTNKVARLEAQCKRSPSLSDYLILGWVEDHLSQIELIIPSPKRPGAPKKWASKRMNLLPDLVREAKRRFGLNTDAEVFRRLLTQQGYKGTKAKQKLKTLQNRLSKARNLSQ